MEITVFPVSLHKDYQVMVRDEAGEEIKGFLRH